MILWMNHLYGELFKNKYLYKLSIYEEVSLYQRGAFLLTASPNEKVLPLAMNMNYKSDEFRKMLVDGLSKC